MRNLKLTLQYDGTNYIGWQRQPSGTSIQEVVEQALAPIEGRPVTAHGAGRTDAGAHALAQVASVTLEASLETHTLGRALNAVLPEDVRVITIEAMPAGFHARFSATGKTYEYRIVNAAFVDAFLFRYVWHVPQKLDIEAMGAAAAPLVGQHDFAAFQGNPEGSVVHSTVRRVESIAWETGGGYNEPLVMRITGEGFLRHMVRNIAGTLVEVGVGRWDYRRPGEVLASRNRALAGPTAPARGLFLVNVRY